jgi:hypothetical protein
MVLSSYIGRFFEMRERHLPTQIAMGLDGA